MALSNRDRIDKMLEIASPALDAFIQSAVQAELTDGADWTMLVALRDEQKGIQGKEYSSTDPQLQLRMLTENIPAQVKEGWYPFNGLLSQVQKSFASELRDARDAWAHHKPFNNDDAYRALDTAERLLDAIGAAAESEAVEKLRLDLRRVTADKDDKKTLRNATASVGSTGLRPWREVLQPHEDVATGNFQAAEFAADLYKVSTDSADQSKDYSDPVEFFSRTYLTEGLRDLIDRAVRRVVGDNNASPVINLQTNFGGGKTHSMLALWHIAAGRPVTDYSQEVQELLTASGYQDVPLKVNRVAIVGNHLAPTGRLKTDGTKVNTIWGELAWQLGGAKAYEIVAESDQAGTAPGEALHELLAAYSPAIILIDEWVAYARQLYGREGLEGGTFETQFTFAQSLTEAVKATPGVLVAISIPASHNADDGDEIAAGSAEEVGGANGLEALKRLQNVVRRVADQWRPASADESYHIVRQRLFVNPDGAALAAIGATAREFVALYRKESADFPSEARETAYEDRIKRSYPIHPELFDRLYEDWATLERFQRTRGVLRLMNTVIHALWVGEDQSPLIMPGSIPLSVSKVNSELTQYLSDSWKSVIDADVDGEHSEPVKIDLEKLVFGQRSLTKRLARTVFFGAAPTIGSSHVGLETQRVFLGTAIPGDVVGNFHSALNQLSDRATYFYSGSGKYWYDLQANISRRAKDQSERLHPEDVWAEVIRRLSGQSKLRGAFAGVVMCPDDSADILDTDEARLIVVHPKATHKRNVNDSAAMKFAQAATERRGTANRVNRNMVVFLAADDARMEELQSAVRDYLGWKEVADHSDELNLNAQQKKQAESRRDQASQTADDRLLGAYHWVLAAAETSPGASFTIDVVKAEGQATSLAERVSKKLGNDGTLMTTQAAQAIRFVLDHKVPTVWADGHVSVGKLWGLFAAYPYMPRLRDQSVLNEGLTSQVMLWQADGFAFAEGYNADTGRYEGLVLPSDNAPVLVRDTLLIVKPEKALVQRAAETSKESQGTENPDDDDDKTDVEVPTPPKPPGPPPKPVKTRFFGSRDLSPDKYAADFKKIHDEVLSHLAGTPGVKLSVRIEIEAIATGGFDDNKVRTVKENADVLKFDQAGFEES